MSWLLSIEHRLRFREHALDALSTHLSLSEEFLKKISNKTKAFTC
jgi:hypothetical protein